MTFSDIEAEKQISLMRQIIHNSPIAKAMLNSKLIICGANKRLCEETGYHASELYGEHINKILKKENHEKHIKSLDEWFASPRTMRLKTAAQLYTVGKDGHETKVTIDIYPLEVWEKNGMIQDGEVVKPKILACAAIVIDNE